MRAAVTLILLAAAAAGGPKVGFVDGREEEGARILSADARQVRLQVTGGEWQVPLRNLAFAEFDATTELPAPPNLFLRNGDALSGAVRGDGESVVLESPAIAALRLPLSEVAAVRFGRLMGTTQAAYDEAFEKLRAAGRDALLVQRETRPFPVEATVVAVGEDKLKVRAGGNVLEMEARQVYGFVLKGQAEGPGEAEGVFARLFLADGGRLTIPPESIDAEVIAGRGARVRRDHVARAEFVGDHFSPLTDFEPVSVEEAAQFGPAPAWRRSEMVHGGPLRTGGREFSRGIGVHARSRLEYALNGRWRSFFVICGIDDEAGEEGDALFRIVGDGKTLAEVRLARGDGCRPLLVDVAGVQRLRLEAEPGDSFTSDFCDWAEARLFNAEPMPPRPGGNG